MANPRDGRADRRGHGFRLRAPRHRCDRHLVQLLLVPFRRFRPHPDPGRDRRRISDQYHDREPGGYGLGPRPDPAAAPASGGLGAAEAGAVLLLGSSMGGELFNPGAVEMRKLAELTGLPGGRARRDDPPGSEPRRRARRPCSVFWLLSLRRQHRRIAIDGQESRPTSRAPVRERSASTRSRPSCRSCRWRSCWPISSPV